MKQIIALAVILTTCALAGHAEDWNPAGLAGGTVSAARGQAQTPVTKPPVAAPAGGPAPIGQCKNQKNINGVEVCFPDSTITPGKALPAATKDTVCVKGYAGDMRDVVDATKEDVIKSYGIPYVAGEEGKTYEIDHLISLELGGSNDPENLWPEPYAPVPGAREKDRVEDYLHELVCASKVTLQRAQQIISTDWYSCYISYKAKQVCQ